MQPVTEHQFGSHREGMSEYELPVIQKGFGDVNDKIFVFL